jgi:hypothetical protein
VQAIIVNRVSIAKPQLASIIRYNAESVSVCPENSHATGPTHSKVVASVESRPLATCVPVVYHVFPASLVYPAAQVLAMTTLSKVEDVLHE